MFHRVIAHHALLPLSEPPREGAARMSALALGLAAMLIGAGAAVAAERPRVVSINVCTDQLVLALADPAQIIGLSPYSRDLIRSFYGEEATRYPLLSGGAEDVLALKPDVVLAGRFTKRATRELLRDQGLNVVEFDAARSIEDAKSQILRMGGVLGQDERAQAEVARIDVAVVRAKESAARSRLRVLPVSRRGWVSGGDSLMSALLTTVGLTNAAREMGLRLGSFAPLETIVAMRPDLLVVSDGGNTAEDQGRAFLMHPALEQLYPAEKRIVVPEALTVCGGPMIARALDTLSTEMERVAR